MDSIGKLPEKIIDFHVHLFPDKIFDAIWKSFNNLYNCTVLYQFYYKKCIEYLEAQGVSPIVYSNYAHKAGVAQLMNEWNVSVLNEYPNLFCFAAYHPDDANALEYAEQVLSHPRVVGIKLHFLIQRFYPHDKRLFPLYEMVIKKKKRLLLHMGTGPVGNEFVGFRHFKKVLDHYPEIPANIAHMGGLEYREFLNLLDDHRNLVLDTSFTFWPETPWCFNLEKSALEKHKDNIVYGSDFPNIILPREGEIKYLLDLNLSRDFYNKIFRENGLMILNMKEKGAVANK